MIRIRKQSLPLQESWVGIRRSRIYDQLIKRKNKDLEKRKFENIMLDNRKQNNNAMISLLK